MADKRELYKIGCTAPRASQKGWGGGRAFAKAGGGVGCPWGTLEVRETPFCSERAREIEETAFVRARNVEGSQQQQEWKKKGGDEEREERGARVCGADLSNFVSRCRERPRWGRDTDLLTPTYVATRLPSRFNVIRRYAPSDIERRFAFDRQRRHSRENVKISCLAVPTHDQPCFRHGPNTSKLVRFREPRVVYERRRNDRVALRRVAISDRRFHARSNLHAPRSSGLCPDEKFHFLPFSNGERRCNGESGKLCGENEERGPTEEEEYARGASRF